MYILIYIPFITVSLYLLYVFLWPHLPVYVPFISFYLFNFMYSLYLFTHYLFTHYLSLLYLFCISSAFFLSFSDHLTGLFFLYFNVDRLTHADDLHSHVYPDHALYNLHLLQSGQ